MCLGATIIPVDMAAKMAVLLVVPDGAGWRIGAD
jgi:hypothetical protein